MIRCYSIYKYIKHLINMEKKDNNDNNDNNNDKNDKKDQKDKNELINYISSNLTEYEKGEIFYDFDIDELYYTGNLYKKINKEINYISHKFNDLIYNAKLSDRYKIIMGDHINYRYEIMYELGKGVYGNVIKVMDHKTHNKMALKIYKNSHFYNKFNRKEIQILNFIKEYYKNDIEYVLLIQETFIFRNHYCMVSKLYGLNLYDNRYGIKYLSFLNKLKILQDILHGLNFLKNGCGDYTIIHGDIKPENIFMKGATTNPEVIIGDFGLSKKILKNTYFSNNYIIQSLHYQAPDIQFKIPFNESIDIWSIGCIIYELFCGQVLIPTKNDRDHIIFIHQILGEPCKDYINSHTNIKPYYHNFRAKYLQDSHFITRLPSSNLKLEEKNFSVLYKKQFELLLSNTSIKNSDIIQKEITFILNLIYKCLVFESEKRITPLGALDYIDYVINEYNS